MNMIKYYIVFLAAAILLCGCSGYSNKSLYPEDVKTVYLEMFDNASFYRGQEYQLTDSLAKRIEADTPYKIISDRDKADTILSGEITDVAQGVVSSELETGRPLEKRATLVAVFSWKDLRSGQYLLEGKSVAAEASFVPLQQQSFEYASDIAANRLAQRIVEAMQKGW